MTQHRKLIAVDFDGVIHSYTTPWTDAAAINDLPTPGAMEFLRRLIEDGRFEFVVVLSRLSEPEGRRAVEEWIYDEMGKAMGPYSESRGHILAEQIRYSETRPPAFLTIDDRGWRFEGEWPDLDTLAAFRLWNKLPKRDQAYRDAVADMACRNPGYTAPPQAEIDEMMQTLSRPSLLVMGTPTARDDLMIDAIAAGLAEGEAARRRKAVDELAEWNPGYTPPSREAIDEMMEVMELRPGGPVPWAAPFYSEDFVRTLAKQAWDEGNNHGLVHEEWNLKYRDEAIDQILKDARAGKIAA